MKIKMLERCEYMNQVLRTLIYEQIYICTGLHDE